MDTTAHKFKKNPNCVYRHADLGGVVTIEHSHYPDKVFELTARERRSFKVGDKVEIIGPRSSMASNMAQSKAIGLALRSSYEQGIEDSMLDKPKTYKATDNGFTEDKE